MKNKIKIGTNTKRLLKTLFEFAHKKRVEIYVVGGYVRDLLLGEEGKDIDFVVIGDAIKFAREFRKEFKTSALVTYERYGTCMLQYRGYKLEFVSAREESYSKDSRKPEVKEANLFSDLSRRDFTINTLAMNVNPEKFGEIIDVYNGLEDLENGIIKTPLEPQQTFSDDPLRIMRAIRFATQLNFHIEENTLEAIKQTADRLQIVSQERITDEFNKIILSGKPSVGLKLLDQCDLLQIFLPEFTETKGVEQRQDYHHKDVFYHTLQVLDQLAPTTEKLELRLAALLHDIAKPNTKRFDEKSGWTFHGHDVLGERMSGTILHRLKYSNEIVKYVKKLVRLHLRPMTLVREEVTDSAIRRLLFSAGEDFEDLMKLCRADITSKNPAKVKQHIKNYDIVLKKARDVEQRDKLRTFKSPIDGNEIMERFNLPPGPQIGKIKSFIEDAILEGVIPNEHDAALKYLLEHKKEAVLYEKNSND